MGEKCNTFEPGTIFTLNLGSGFVAGRWGFCCWELAAGRSVAGNLPLGALSLEICRWALCRWEFAAGRFVAGRWVHSRTLLKHNWLHARTPT